MASDPGERVMALRTNVFALFASAWRSACLGGALLHGELARRKGHRDLRNAVYAHVVAAEPAVLRDHEDRRGAVTADDRHDGGPQRRRLQRQMGLRNSVMGAGAMAMLRRHQSVA